MPDVEVLASHMAHELLNVCFCVISFIYK